MKRIFPPDIEGSGLQHPWACSFPPDREIEWIDILGLRAFHFLLEPVADWDLVFWKR